MNDEVHQLHSPYAGRWVALVHGRVVAQGGTPEQALRASQHSRHKEKPEIKFMPASFTLHPLVEKIIDVLPADQEIYLVGGAVRDLLLSRISPDLDFALPTNGIFLARKVTNALHADFIPLDEERDTGRVIVTQEDGSRIFLDFAVYRGATLKDDLSTRDFTINAIAYNLRDETIIDPMEGGNDIRAKLIRACSPTTFSDDPVRILRAIRQAAALDFRIDKDSRELMKQSVDQLGRVSPERLRDEVFKILKGPKPHTAMRALEMLGVLPYLMPELVAMKGVEQSEPHVYDVWTHTLAVLDYLDQIIHALRVGYDAEKTNDMFTGLLGLQLGRFREPIAKHFATPLNVDRSLRSLLFFAALYHDVSKPETKTIEESGRIRFFNHDVQGADVATDRAHAFNLSNDEIDRLRIIILNHMRLHSFADRLINNKQAPTRKAIYRFFRDSGAGGFDLVLLGLADLRASYAHSLTIETWSAYLEVARTLLENYFEKPEEIIAPPRLLNGRDVMNELGLKPGPIVGQILEAIREEQAEGKVNSRAEAIICAHEWIKENPVNNKERRKRNNMEKVLVNNITLAYERFGKGIPLMLIHGFPLDHTSWKEAALLLENEFDIIMPDLRGFGQSTTVEMPYTVSDMADDLVGLLDHLGIEKTVLAGHSMGGYVALAFAKKYPHRVSGLGLISSQAVADSPERKEGRYKTASDVAEKGVGVVAEAMTSKLSANADVQAYVRDVIEKQSKSAVIGALKAMAERDDLLSLLSSLAFPILLIHGDADIMIPIERAQEIKSAMPSAQLMVLQSAGHMPMMEFPNATADGLRLLTG